MSGLWATSRPWTAPAMSAPIVNDKRTLYVGARDRGTEHLTVRCHTPTIHATGGLEESVTQEILQAVFLPFGEITDVNLPLDNASRAPHATRAIAPLAADALARCTAEKHRGFAFVQFEDRGDAADAIDNMNNAELFGRVLKVNIAKPSASVGGHRPGELCSCPCTCSHLLSRWWSLRQSGSRKPTPTTRTSRRAGTTPRARQGPHESGRGSLVLR